MATMSNAVRYPKSLLDEAQRSAEMHLLAFNNGCTEAIAELFEPMAVLETPNTPLYIGRDDIASYWEDLINTMHSSGELSEQQIHFISPETICATSVWTLNEQRPLTIQNTWSYGPDFSVAIITQTVTQA